MRCVVSAWVSMTMADLCTASGSVCLVTAGVFEVLCAASGRVAANRIKAREIFMVGAGPSVCHFLTENLFLCIGRADLRSRAPLGKGADGGPKFIAPSDAGAQIIAVHHRNHFQLNFFFNDAGPPEIFPVSLHGPLPI